MLRRALSVLVFAGVAVACGGKDPTNPGVGIGEFKVTATLTSTTCGTTPNPWVFDVRLNRDGSTLYWIQNSLPIAGAVDSSARTKLETSVTSELRHATDKNPASCSVTRSDAVDMALANEEAKPAVDPADARKFSGVLRYTFAPTDGSQCDDQLLSTGGDFAALPCVVTYMLDGEMTKAADAK